MPLTRKLCWSASCLWLCVSFFSPGVFAEKSADPKLLAIRGRDLLLSRRYADAEIFFRKLATENPKGLLGPLGMMALYQIRNLENFDFRYDDLYLSWEKRGRLLAMEIADSPSPPRTGKAGCFGSNSGERPSSPEPPSLDPNIFAKCGDVTGEESKISSWDVLMAGSALGISGYYRAHNSRWLAALRDGTLGVRLIEEGYRRDPSMTDIFFALGQYRYWRSHFTRKFRFLPFFPDRRQEGKELLVRAVQEAEFSSPLAEIALAFIDFQEKRYNDVLQTTERLLKRYPKNTIIRMLRGEAFLASKKYGESVREFEILLKEDSSITKSYLFMGLGTLREGRHVSRGQELLRRYLELDPKASFFWRKKALDALSEQATP